MNTFASSIRKKYQERCINFEKQFPPGPDRSNKLISLDIVERDKMQLKGQDAKQTPLAYENLFKTENRGRPVRKILVEGDAGIGKTSLTFRISEDWADGKLFQQFELLLLLPLRQTEISLARSLPDLLKLLHPSPSIQDSVALYIQENEGEKVLIIADGWDELSEANRREDSFLYKLLFKMPFISVMLTSRPLASAPLHRLQCFDQFIEMKGFNRASIEEYIQSEFIDDVDKQKGSHLLEKLESNPLVASLCSVPLNCAILCHLWRASEEALPTTMAEMFKKIILNVILRNFSKIPDYDSVTGLSDFDSLPKDLQRPWQHLCEFAYEAIEKDQIVFSQKELANFFPQDMADSIFCFGLLQSTESILDAGYEVSFNFMHLTFQEYLAALHLAKQPAEILSKIIRSHSILEINQKQYNPKSFFPDAMFTSKSRRFWMVFQLFFGIFFHAPTHIDIQMLTRFISQISNWPLPRSFFCHLAFEAKSITINTSVVSALQNSSMEGGMFFIHDVTIFQFGHSRTAYDCTAVIYVISNMEECGGIEINFSNSGVGDSQIKLLTDALASKQGKLQVLKMNLSGNRLSDKAISDLFHRASVAFKCPVNLDLSYNMAGAETIKSITTTSEAWPRPHSMPPGPLPQIAKKVDTTLSHSMVEAKSTKCIATTFEARPPVTTLTQSSSPKITQGGNLELSHNIMEAENIKSMITLEAGPPVPLLPDPVTNKMSLNQDHSRAGAESVISISTAFETRSTVSMSPPPPQPPLVAKTVNVDPSHNNMAGAKSIKSMATAFEGRPTVPMPPPPPPPPPPPAPFLVNKKVNVDLIHNMAGAENILQTRPAIPMPPGPPLPPPPPPQPPRVARKDPENDQLALERALRRFPFDLTLNLSHNDLQVSGMHALEEGMRLIGSFGNLTYLHLNGSLSKDADFNAAWLVAFLETYCCRKLSFLDISQNNLSVPGASVLGRVISEHHLQLGSVSKFLARKVNLSDTNLGDEGLFAFIGSFNKPCNLTELVLTSNDIHAVGIYCLADAIDQSGNIKNLNKIYLSKNPLGLEGVIASGRLLSGSRCKLEILALSRCQLTTIGDERIDTNSQGHDSTVITEEGLIRDAALQLRQMAPQHTIRFLILNGNCFTGVRIHILASFIRLCPRLNNLATSDCRITTEDLTQLLDELTRNMKSTSPQLCSNIENWNLTSNEIDSSGASALVSCVPSLFPRLKTEHLILDNNPIDSDSMTASLKIRPRTQYPMAKPQMTEKKNGMCIVSILLSGY